MSKKIVCWHCGETVKKHHAVLRCINSHPRGLHASCKWELESRGDIYGAEYMEEEMAFSQRAYGHCDGSTPETQNGVGHDENDCSDPNWGRKWVY